MVRPRGDAIYSQSGGYLAGRNFWLSNGANWPFARFVIYRDKLVIKTFWPPCQCYVLRRKEITSITPYILWLWVGIQIHHTTRRYSPFIAFRTWNSDELLGRLRENGFPVATPTI
jgi:hypothetical protein